VENNFNFNNKNIYFLYIMYRYTTQGVYIVKKQQESFENFNQGKLNTFIKINQSAKNME
jgi:hypothetical protein